MAKAPGLGRPTVRRPRRRRRTHPAPLGNARPRTGSRGRSGRRAAGKRGTADGHKPRSPIVGGGRRRAAGKHPTVPREARYRSHRDAHAPRAASGRRASACDGLGAVSVRRIAITPSSPGHLPGPAGVAATARPRGSQVRLIDLNLDAALPDPWRD